MKAEEVFGSVCVYIYICARARARAYQVTQKHDQELVAPAKPALAVLETLGLIPLGPLHASGWMNMTFLLSVSVSRTH